MTEADDLLYRLSHCSGCDCEHAAPTAGCGCDCHGIPWLREIEPDRWQISDRD